MKTLYFLILISLPSCELAYDVFSTKRSSQRYADQIDAYNDSLFNHGTAAGYNGATK